MRALVILAHPDPGSFNHALAQTACDALRSLGHSVVLHDLYAEGFDPCLPAQEIPRTTSLPPDVEAHCRDLHDAEALVLVHPNWWGQPPAMLKGWVDRIVRPDVAYRFVEGDNGEGIPVGLLNCRGALILNTSNTAAERERTVFGDPLEAIWCRCILEFCGVQKIQRRMFETVVTSTLEQRRAWLQEAARLVQELFPQEPGA